MRCSPFFTLIFRSSSVPNSMLLRSFTDFAPTLHRLWYGGRAKDQRTCIGGTLRKNRRICLELSLPLLVKLVGIYEVMPDAVETAYNGGDRIEEYKSHPDDENRVFLAESLTCSYGRTLDRGNIFAFVLAFRLGLCWLLPTLADSPSESELDHTAYGTYGCKSEENA